MNGSNSAQTFYAPDGIFVDMGSGNDSLTLKNLTINGESGDVGLGILLGAGTDALLVQSVTVNWETAIDGGEGNNAIVINSCHFNYDLGIQTYGGTDAVTITNTQILGALQVQLGNGKANALTMVNDSVVGAPGQPDDSDLPDGFEILECTLPREECGANIVGGTGVDAIALNKVQIDCLTTIDTCSGVDSVAIVNSRFGNQPMVYSLQPLQDGGSEASGLCIETGLGNDAVAITTTTVYGFLQIDTSGQVCCPCEGRMLEVTPSTPSSTSVKDGVDAVALTKVNVYAAQQEQEWLTPDVVTTQVEQNWECCCFECGALLIYTGNQNDAVALAFVCTDCFAKIDTTDLCDSSLDGADAVAISNSKFGQQERCDWVTDLSICTGRGNDVVSIVKVNVVGKAFIDTGDGTDAVAINALAADHICVELDGGNHDALTIINSSASDAFFDGGDGSGDVLVRSHNNFGSEYHQGFETVV